MGTQDVRIDTRLNKAIWSQGVRGVPFRFVLVYTINVKYTVIYDEDDLKLRAPFELFDQLELEVRMTCLSTNKKVPFKHCKCHCQIIKKESFQII